jgi:hypothetical protein
MNNAILIGSIVGGVLVLLATGGFYTNKKMENDRLDLQYNNWTAGSRRRKKRNANTRKRGKKY